MIDYKWHVVSGSYIAATQKVEIRSTSNTVGHLKVIGHSGAVAETPIGSLSFRGAGLDPAKRSLWKRRESHDATVIRLATGDTIASFAVSPFRKRLQLAHGSEYFWKSSFLMNRGVWKCAKEAVCTIEQAFTVRERRGTISCSTELGESGYLLAFFGLYLFLSGRAG